MEEQGRRAERYTTITVPKYREDRVSFLTPDLTEAQKEELRASFSLERLRWKQNGEALTFWRDGQVTLDGPHARQGTLPIRDYGFLCSILSLTSRHGDRSRLQLEAWDLDSEEPHPLGAPAEHPFLQEIQLAALEASTQRVTWQ